MIPPPAIVLSAPESAGTVTITEPPAVDTPPEPPAPPNPDVAKHLRQLKLPAAADRTQALGRLAAMGVAAGEAAGPVCDALMDNNATVRVAALKALEQVRPDLYPSVSSLLLDKALDDQTKAVAAIGLMGDKAKPVIRLLMVRLRNAVAGEPRSWWGRNPDGELTHALLEAVVQIDPEGKEVVALYHMLAGPAVKTLWVRDEAIGYLVKWAGEDTARRKAVVPHLAAGLPTAMQHKCVERLGDYGTLAAAQLETIRRLKLSDSADIREAAGRAVDKIEAAKANR